MRVVICCALLCAVVAFVQSSQQSQSPGFDEEQTYTYSVQGHVVSGVGNSQHDGMQLGYQIQVTRINQDTLHLKPKNFKSLRNCETQCQENRNQQISADLLKYLQSPIEVTVRQGKVSVLQLEAGMPVWAVNIKKSQVAPFIVNTDAPAQNQNQNTGSGATDNKEKTVYGQCKVQYRVSEADEDNELQQQQQQQQNGNQIQNNQRNQSRNQNPQQNRRQPQQKQQQKQQESQESQQGQRQQQKAAANKQHITQDQNDSNDSDSAESRERDNNNDRSGFFGRLAHYLPYASSSEQDQEEDEEQTVKRFCGNNQQTFQIIKKYTVSQCENTPFPANNNTQSASAQQMNNLRNRVVITRYLACGPNRRNYDIIRIDREEQSQAANSQNPNGQSGQANRNNVQNQGPVQAIQKYVLTSISSASVQRLERPKNLSFLVNLAYNFNAKPLQASQQPYGDQPYLQQHLNQARQEGSQRQQQGWQRQQPGGQYNQQQGHHQHYEIGAGQIQVFLDPYFGGEHTNFDIQPNQCYNVPDRWNDVISSIDTGDYCFIVYEHGGCNNKGNSVRLERYSYGSQKLGSVGLNDMITSIQLC